MNSRRRARPRSRVALLLELLLWSFSVFALGTVGAQLVDAALFQERAERLLDTQQHVPSPSLPSSDTITVERGPIVPGTPLARLEIPRLGIAGVVAEGDNEETLRRAIGHLPGTALPGTDGNVALAAHRDTFFRGLGEIRTGDLVDLETRGHRHGYRVAWTEVVDPSRVDVVRATSRPSLTLITCYPFRWIGPAPQRFVVRAHLDETSNRAEDSRLLAPLVRSDRSTAVRFSNLP